MVRHKLIGENFNSSLYTAESNVSESNLAASSVIAPHLAASVTTTPAASEVTSSNSIDTASDDSNSPEIVDGRFDGFDNAHWPFNDEKKCQSRCKLKGCKGQTHVYCGKCSNDKKMVHLCFTKQRNCFLNYHDPNY